MPGLEDLYREIILDHYRNPRNRGELPAPPAYAETGFNPLCGDEITLYLQLEGDQLADVKLTGQGCSISQSSASMMSTAVKGKSLAETRATIRKFKSMMSIHEQRLDGPGDGEPVTTRRPRRRGAGPVRPGERRRAGGVARRPGGPAGSGEVPGADQVRHPLVEHPRPGPGSPRIRAGGASS